MGSFVDDLKVWLQTAPAWLFGFGLAALLGVWWWKMNATTSNATTVLGVAALSLAVFLSPQLTDESLLVRLLYANATISILSLVAYHVLWTPPKKSVAAASQQPTAPVPSSETVQEKPERIPDRIKSIGEITVGRSGPLTGDRSVFALKKGVSSIVSISPLIPEPDLKPANPSDLDFYFFPKIGGAFEDKVQYATATLTNRTAQKMHLELWGHVDYWKDDGVPQRMSPRAEWNPDGFKERTGQEFVELEAHETKQGRIMLSLGETKSHGISRWFVDINEDVYIEVFDTVTGKRSAFKAMKGYPLGQIPAPLAPVKEMLALDFPKADGSKKKHETPIESLQLVLRTADETYGEGEKGMQATIVNKSNDFMEIGVNLLICDPPGGSLWQSRKGIIKVTGVDNKESSGREFVTVVPDATVLVSLKFDLSDLSANKPEDWTPTAALPKEVLLEVHDRVSAKTVWCAIHSGYPPGTDMRPFTIKKKNVEVSGNPPPDKSNTPE